MNTQVSLWRFACVGVFNTVFGLALIFGSQVVFGLSDVAANATGYGLALLAGFAFNRRWTFRHEGRAAPALVRYVLVVATAYLANLACLLLVRDGLGWPAPIAQVISIFPYAVIGYAGSRWFAFFNFQASPDATLPVTPPAAPAGSATKYMHRQDCPCGARISPPSNMPSECTPGSQLLTPSALRQTAGPY